MAKVNIEVLAGEVEQRIQELQNAGGNLQPAWQAVGNMLVNRINMGFRLSKDPWGTPWKPIKFRAPRISKKGKLTKVGRNQVSANASGNAGKPLVDKGILRRSITAQADASGVVVGTNLAYARVHQFGDVITPKKKRFLVFPGPSGALIFARRVVVPPRPYMPINASGQLALPTTWAKNIIQTLAAHFKLGQQSVAS